MNDIILKNKDAERVRALLVNGMQVAGVASSKATYYHSAQEQQEAVKHAVTDMFNAGAELPLLVAVHSGVRGFFIQETILNDLDNPFGSTVVVNGDTWRERYRANALRMAFNNLRDNSGTTYVLRMLIDARDRRINNTVTRTMALNFIFGSDAEFMAVKYRDKVRRVFQHCLGGRMASRALEIASRKGDYKSVDEQKWMYDNVYKYAVIPDYHVDRILLYVFGTDMKLDTYPRTAVPILRQAVLAREDVLAVDKVPEEVLTGLLANPNHPQHSLWMNEIARNDLLARLRERDTVTTENVKLRRTKQDREKGIETEVKMDKVTDPIALLKTHYETGGTTEILQRISALADERRIKNFPYGTIAVVHDKSPSMRGHHQESKNTPRAITEFTGMVLSRSAEVAGYSLTNGNETDIATAFMKAVQNTRGVEAVFILSDGYENAQDGLFAQVLREWRKAYDSHIPVYHISPIGAAEAGGMARQLAPGALNVLSVGATAETLPTVIESHLLEADLYKWLERAVKRIGG